MAKFKKSIVSAGVFLVGNDKGGRHTEVIDEPRLRHWATVANKMRSRGISIPAPWAHAGDCLPVRMGQDGTLPRADLNAGFWDGFHVETDPQTNTPTLYGMLDIPGDPNDPNSPAGKVGKTVKETSIYARPSFDDGHGHTYKDALMHVALVTHPIEPGQKNFELQPNDAGYVISMSHCQYQLGAKMALDNDVEDVDQDPDADGKPNVSGNATDFTALLELLREIGVDLPEDTSEENFRERLFVALRQKCASDSDEDDEEGSIRKPPKEAEEDSVPSTLMSNTNKAPEVTADTIMSHPTYKALEAQNKQLFTAMNNQARASRATRVNSLIQSGRVTKEYADQHLVPLLDGFQMSFNNEGKEVLTALDVTLNALEAIPAPSKPNTTPAPANIPFANPTVQALAPFLMSSVAPEGANTPEHPLKGFLSDGAVTDEEADKIVDSLFV